MTTYEIKGNKVYYDSKEIGWLDQVSTYKEKEITSKFEMKNTGRIVMNVVFTPTNGIKLSDFE